MSDQSKTSVKPPKLTVITTVHNGQRFLDETLESILNQDFTDLEYIVIDDGSSDGSWKVLERWAARDTRLLIERLPAHVGISAAFNRGLALARGQYICRHDADDIHVGSRLRHQVDHLDANPDTVLVTANYIDVDESGNLLSEEVVENPPAVIAYLLTFGKPLMAAGSQGMFRTDMARTVGGFREDFDVSVDHDFLCKLSARGRIVVLPEFGLKKRLHEGQVSVRSLPEQLRNCLISARPMLSAQLGRSLSDEEFLAVASICHRHGRTGVSSTGNRLLRESFLRFASSDRADKTSCDIVRRIIAGWWVHAAVPLVKKGALVDAGLHLVYAATWHPSSLATCLVILAERLASWWRRARRLSPATKRVEAHGLEMKARRRVLPRTPRERRSSRRDVPSYEQNSLRPPT